MTGKSVASMLALTLLVDRLIKVLLLAPLRLLSLIAKVFGYVVMIQELQEFVYKFHLTLPTFGPIS